MIFVFLCFMMVILVFTIAPKQEGRDVSYVENTCVR